MCGTGKRVHLLPQLDRSMMWDRYGDHPHIQAQGRAALSVFAWIRAARRRTGGRVQFWSAPRGALPYSFFLDWS
jgi:hypothetical protein